jgi:hypothetical protein
MSTYRSFFSMVSPALDRGPHRHPYDEIQFVQEGRGLWVVNGEEFERGRRRHLRDQGRRGAQLQERWRDAASCSSTSISVHDSYKRICSEYRMEDSGVVQLNYGNLRQASMPQWTRRHAARASVHRRRQIVVGAAHAQGLPVSSREPLTLALIRIASG